MASPLPEIYDALGIGWGPANLALAVAMEEAAADRPLRSVFLESKPSFAWHPGMLIEDSLLQVTVLKDLILVENPRSRFTFLCYLKEQGRLYDFLNLRDLFPTRLEFNDYLGWVANQLSHRVHYNRQALRVEPLTAEGRPSPRGAELLRVVARDTVTGEEVAYLTRHLVVATGGEPQTPDGVDLREGGRAFHSFEFKQRVAAFDDREAPYRFVVIGGGQSAGEIFEYFIDHYPRADVTATTRQFSYKPVDESDFTNRIFFPEWVDYYHDLPPDKRRRFFDLLKDVNYAVIDHSLIARIYQKLYRQKVAGRERARLRPFLELQSLRDDAEHVALTFRDLMLDETVEIEADAAVLCTGYAWRKEHPLLEGLAHALERDDLGGYRVERDYRLAARSDFTPRVFLQGYCEDTHGISETVLSLLPVRAKDILTSIMAALETRPANTVPAS